MHLSTRYGGPDRIAGLVRVEIVMAAASRPSAAEVIARLEASDASNSNCVRVGVSASAAALELEWLG